MSFTKKMMSFLLIALVVSTSVISVAAEVPINLGSASSFAILAGQTITNTGTTTINGDVGIAPGSSFTQGPAIINGVIHLNDAVAIQAKQDLVTAFNDTAGRTPTTTIPSELGGKTLLPGYYVSAAGTFNLTGTLTLDGNGDPNAIFVFETATTLVTATSSNVNLINGASAKQVFWNIGSSATLGITSHLEGTILAMESITLTTGATINGSLLARNGSVTLDSNTVGAIVAAPIIAIDKTANKSVLTNGAEIVIYSYRITNPGSTNLLNIIVTDDKISTVNYVSGDSNANLILEPTEAWLYTATVMLSNTTTNIGTVTAISNNIAVTATDQFTITVQNGTVATTEPTEATTNFNFEIPVVVEPTAESTELATEVTTETATQETTTVETGGMLPQTASPLLLYVSSGIVLMILGVVGLKFNR